MATETTPATPQADDYDVDWPVKLGGHEFMVPGMSTWTPQQVVAAGLKQLAKEGPGVMGPDMGPIPLTAEGKVPSAPYVTEQTQLAGTQERLIPRLLQASGFGSTVEDAGRTALLNAVGLPAMHVGGELATRLGPTALKAAYPKVGRIVEPAARWIGETGSGLLFGKSLGEISNAKDSDQTALQGGLMGFFKQPVTGLVKRAAPYAQSFIEAFRGRLPPSPDIPGSSLTIPERAVQIMEQRAGLAPGTLTPKSPREIALAKATEDKLAGERKLWEETSANAKRDLGMTQARHRAEQARFETQLAEQEQYAQAQRNQQIADQRSGQQISRDQRQAEIAAERGRVAAVKEQARLDAKTALEAEKADKVQYQAGYEMSQAKGAQAADLASQRMAAQATDDTADLTGRVFGIPKDKVDLHNVLIGVEGKRLAHEAYEKGLNEVEGMLKLGTEGPTAGQRVVKWLAPDASGKLIPVDRVAGGKGGAFDELSKLGQKSWTYTGTQSNRAAREMYNLQRETMFESMPPEAQEYFHGLQREYSTRRGLAGFFGHVADALNMDTLQVDIAALRKGIGKSSIWQRFQDRFGEQESDAVRKLFGVGTGPLPNPAQPERFILRPGQSP